MLKYSLDWMWLMEIISVITDVAGRESAGVKFNWFIEQTSSDGDQLEHLREKFFYIGLSVPCIHSWLGGSVVERRSLTGELSLVCTEAADDG